MNSLSCLLVRSIAVGVHTNPLKTVTDHYELATRMERLGHISEFHPDNETISAYLERLDMFLQANDVKAEKKVPVLLSVIGPKAYSLLRSLTTPDVPKDKSFAELAKILKAHYEPQPILIAERYRFHRRDQNPGESTADYIAELKRLTTHCKFGDYLEQALRDRLVCGLRNDSVRKHLLTKTELTFATAQELALSLEAAERQANELKGTEPAVLHVGAAQPPTNEACYRCGSTRHKQIDCKFKQAVCHGCRKRGHIRRVCRSQAKGMQQPQRTKWVEAQGEQEPDEEYGIYSVRMSSPSPILVDVEVEGKPITMEVDTGAGLSVISEHRLKHLLLQTLASLKETSVQMKAYGGEALTVLGKLQVQVQYGAQQAALPLYVVAGDGPCLFGRQWLKTIRLDWKAIGLSVLTSRSGRMPHPSFTDRDPSRLHSRGLLNKS